MYQEKGKFVLVLSRAHGGDKPEGLDVFLAYEVASFEGFAVFGIDALNDSIATEAGHILAARIRGGKTFGSQGELEEELDEVFASARQRVLLHDIFRDRKKARRAFFAMQLATDADGEFAPIFVSGRVVWPATLGTVLYKNRKKLSTEAGRKLFVKFVEARFYPSEDWTKPISGLGITLSKGDMRGLNEIVEVLSLIDEEIPGQRE